MKGLKRENHIMCGIQPPPHIFSPLLKRLFNHSEENSRAGVHCPCWQHLLWRQWHSSCVQCDTRGRPLRSCWDWAHAKLWSGLATQHTALNTNMQKICKIYFRLIKIVCISFPACCKYSESYFNVIYIWPNVMSGGDFFILWPYKFD